MNDFQLIEKSVYIDILQVSSHGKSILSFIISLLVLIDETCCFSSLQVFLPLQPVVRKNSNHQLKRTISWFHDRHSSYESSPAPILQNESSDHQVMSEVSEVSIKNESPSTEKKSPQPEIKSSQPETQSSHPEIKPPQPEIKSSQSEVKTPQPEIQSSQPETKSPQPRTKSKTKRVTSQMKFDSSVRIIEILHGET